MAKGFKTYDEQIEYLESCKKISCSKEEEREMLVRNGYFNLVNGYKLPFSSRIEGGEHQYIQGASIGDLYAVKKFDDELRLTLFKQITRIESEIRTIVGHYFDQVNEMGKFKWDDPNAYDASYYGTEKIQNLIDRLQGNIDKSQSDYLMHYLDNYEFVPTWILVKVIDFSTFIAFLGRSKKEIKKVLCNLYQIKDKRGYYDPRLMIGGLQYIRIVRNACAHNERIFDLSRVGALKMEWVRHLPKSYRRNTSRDKRIIDFIITLRYYLQDEDYYIFLDEVYELLSLLREEIPTVAFDYVRGKMGIKNMEDIECLKGTNKKIQYLGLT